MSGQWGGLSAVDCRDPVLRGWLREPDSLTARCERACREFRVRLLTFRREDSLFVTGRGKRWVREVVLTCDGRPVIFAHTELGQQARGRLRQWLAGLGSRSLGSLLFAYPGFQRGKIEYRRLDARDPLYRRAVAVAETSDGDYSRCLWARCSVHALGMQYVSVTEVFLPAISALTNQGN